MKRTWAFAAALGLMAIAGTMLVVTPGTIAQRR